MPNANTFDWLFENIDSLALHIRACEFACKYKLSYALNDFRKAQTPKIREFILSTFRSLNRSSSSDSAWNELLDEILALQRDVFYFSLHYYIQVFSLISKEELIELYFKSLLYSGKINLCKKLIEKMSQENIMIQLEGHILEASLSFLNSSESPFCQNFDIAFGILELVPSTAAIKSV